MADDSGPAVDLFGDPWTEPKDPRGRKAHKRCPKLAENIAILSATGLTAEAIAAQIGLSEPTLRKYYLPELKEGPRQAQAVLDQVMWAKARSGNVPAAKYMRERFSKVEATEVAYQAPAAASKLGKKEERQAAAEQVGDGMFAPGQPPAKLAH